MTRRDLFRGSFILSRPTLETLEQRIGKAFKIKLQVLASGSQMAHSQVWSVLCYIWVHYLGQSGHKLAMRLNISPQAVYSAAARFEKVAGVSKLDVDL